MRWRGGSAPRSSPVDGLVLRTELRSIDPDNTALWHGGTPVQGATWASMVKRDTRPPSCSEPDALGEWGGDRCNGEYRTRSNAHLLNGMIRDRQGPSTTSTVNDDGTCRYHSLGALSRHHPIGVRARQVDAAAQPSPIGLVTQSCILMTTPLQGCLTGTAARRRMSDASLQSSAAPASALPCAVQWPAAHAPAPPRASATLAGAKGSYLHGDGPSLVGGGWSPRPCARARKDRGQGQTLLRAPWPSFYSIAIGALVRTHNYGRRTSAACC